MKKTLIEIYRDNYFRIFVMVILIALTGVIIFHFASSKIEINNAEVIAKNRNLLENVEEFVDGDIVDLKLRDIDFKLEVAKTTKAQQKGLQFRETLPANEGMLFVNKVEGVHSFWMKNTLIPLDIIFLDKDFRVVKVHRNTIPNQTAQLYNSVKPSKYVIELNALTTDKFNIKEGEPLEVLALTKLN